MTKALALSDHEQKAIESVKRLVNIVTALRSEEFQDGIDYGTIPGTNDKPVLLLPGMEKLMRALNLRPEYVLVSSREDFDTPLFFYRYECRLMDIESGQIVSTAIGSANSKEAKWAWRWVAEHDVPAHLDKSELVMRRSSIEEPAFAIDKAETTGKYGKPTEYWQRFRDAIEAGTAQQTKKQKRDGSYMDAWRIDSTVYRVPNPDIYDQLNTIDKIAQKRALSSAIKGAANVSMFFTVDVEDMVITRPDPVTGADVVVNQPPVNDDVVDGTAEVVETPKPPKKQQASRNDLPALPEGIEWVKGVAIKPQMSIYSTNSKTELKVTGKTANGKNAILTLENGDSMTVENSKTYPVRKTAVDKALEATR